MQQSLMAGELDVAERAFVRIRDIKYIDLIHSKAPRSSPPQILTHTRD